MSGVGSSPALATCETSQVLLEGVPGGFSEGSPETELKKKVHFTHQALVIKIFLWPN